MADNVTTQSVTIATVPDGTVIATDTILGVAYQRVKLTHGADGTADDVSTASPLEVTLANTGANATAVKVDGSAVTQPVSGSLTSVATITNVVHVDDNAASLTVDNAGTFAVQAAQSGTWTVQPGNTANTTAWKVDASSVAVPVTDNSGSLTVDAPVATPVFVRLSDGAAAITALPVTDNAGSLTVDGTVAATQSGTWNIGTVTTLTGITNVVHVDDNAGSLTVDGTVAATQSGTWNIGTVTTLTGITNALPSGTNTIGKTYAAYQTTKALTNASVSISSSGDNTIVSGTVSQTIRVFKLVLVATAPVSVTLKDATAGTSLTGAIPLSTNGSLCIDFEEGEPAFVSASGGNFVVNLSAAISVVGFVQYTKS